VLRIGIAIGLQQRGDQLPEAEARRKLRPVGGLHHFEQLLEMEADDVEEQLFLVLVIVVEIGLRDAAGLGDLAHRGTVVAMLGKELGRAIEDRPALLVVIVGAGSGHV